MAQFLIMSVIILFLLWSSSFLFLWIAITRLARMICSLEEGLDLVLLRLDNKEDLTDEERGAVKAKIHMIKERIRKDFEV